MYFRVCFEFLKISSMIQMFHMKQKSVKHVSQIFGNYKSLL